MSSISFTDRITQLDTEIDNVYTAATGVDKGDLAKKVGEEYTKVNQSAEAIRTNWDQTEASKREVSIETSRVLLKMVGLNKELTQKRLI